jgi:putative multiple sugar transport system permease protein
MTVGPVSKPGTPASARVVGEQLMSLVRANLRQFGMLIALVVIVLFFQFTTDGVMLKPQNVTNVFLQNGYIIAMALGMLLVIVAGQG